MCPLTLWQSFKELHVKFMIFARMILSLLVRKQHFWQRVVG